MSIKSESHIFSEYLKPSYFIDSDNPEIIAYANNIIGDETNRRQKAIKLYYNVRDKFIYDPYNILYTPEGFQAGTTLKKGYGFCVTKATLLAALGRVAGIPSRLGFADVRNHLTSPTLLELMKSDVFVWHGYTEFYIDDKWVKATPAFDSYLCASANVKTLEFDGNQDSIFHEFDCIGKKHMEYIKFHGEFSDLPFNQIIASYKKHYKILEELLKHVPEMHIEGNFRCEAVGGSQ